MHMLALVLCFVTGLMSVMGVLTSDLKDLNLSIRLVCTVLAGDLSLKDLNVL